MCSFHSSLLGLLVVLLANVSSAEDSAYYGYGKTATLNEISGWNIDVRPDGQGLPPGDGSVEDGEYLYEDKCAQCHGSFGEGNNQFPALAGGEGTLTDQRPHRTVGSYWPYTSTLWDYINRAMPYAQPESLSDTEVYAITAYVLLTTTLYYPLKIFLRLICLTNLTSFLTRGQTRLTSAVCEVAKSLILFR